MATEPPVVGDPRRKILQMAVSTVLIDSGFDTVERDALETLTEMFQSCKYRLSVPSVPKPNSFFQFSTKQATLQNASANSRAEPNP